MTPGVIIKGKDYQKAKVLFSKFKLETQKSIKNVLKEEFEDLDEDICNHVYISQEQHKTDNYREVIIGFIDYRGYVRKNRI